LFEEYIDEVGEEKKIVFDSGKFKNKVMHLGNIKKLECFVAG
jgi:hypothetical protein